MERKLSRDEKLKGEYGGIVEEQLRAAVIEEAPKSPSGKLVVYMPHKPINCKAECSHVEGSNGVRREC